MRSISPRLTRQRARALPAMACAIRHLFHRSKSLSAHPGFAARASILTVFRVITAQPHCAELRHRGETTSCLGFGFVDVRLRPLSSRGLFMRFPFDSCSSFTRQWPRASISPPDDFPSLEESELSLSAAGLCMAIILSRDTAQLLMDHTVPSVWWVFQADSAAESVVPRCTVPREQTSPRPAPPHAHHPHETPQGLCSPLLPICWRVGIATTERAPDHSHRPLTHSS